MKKLHLLLTIALCALGVPSFAEIHAGFRKAVDNGDITTAVNLRKAGVSDIYCPATMSPGNAVKLYEDELRNNPEILVRNCESGFFEKIGAMACNNPKNGKLCKQVLVETPVYKWGPILDKVIEKDVYNYVDSTCAKKQHSKRFDKCRANFTNEMNRGLSYEFHRIQSNPLDPDWSRPMLMDKMKTIASTASRLEREIESPWDNENAVALYPSKSNLRMNAGCFADESCSAEMLVDRFVEYSYIPDDMGLFFCHLHPEIGNKIKSEKGLDIINCEKLFSTYSQKCSEKNENEVRGINLDHRLFKCQKTKYGWSWVPFGIKAGKTIWALWDNKRGGTVDAMRSTFVDLIKAKYKDHNNQLVQTYEEKMSDYLMNIKGSMRAGTLSYYKSGSFGVLDKDAWYDYWKNYFYMIGNQYSFDEAERSCPDGWVLPTLKQFEKLERTAGNELANVDYIPKHSDKWNFSIREFIKTKEFKNYVPEVNVEPFMMWLADGNIASIRPWPDTVVYELAKPKNRIAYVRCVKRQ